MEQDAGMEEIRKYHEKVIKYVYVTYRFIQRSQLSDNDTKEHLQLLSIG